MMWSRRRRVWEQIYPYLVGLIAAAAVVRYLDSSTKISIIVDLVNPLFGVVSLLLGSVIASLSVVLTGSDLQSIRRLRSTDHFKTFVNYHSETIVASSISGLLSLVVLFYCKTNGGTEGAPIFRDNLPSNLIFVVWSLFTTLSLTTSYRLVRILRALLMQTVKSDSQYYRAPKNLPTTPPKSLPVNEKKGEATPVG